MYYPTYDCVQKIASLIRIWTQIGREDIWIKGL